jgi:hypothetical protein
MAWVVLAGGLTSGADGSAHAAPRATAAVSAAPTVETLSGVVRKVVTEPDHHDGADRHGAGQRGAEPVRTFLQVGRRLLPLAVGSLPAARDGDLVRVTLFPDTGGDRRVRSATMVRGVAAANSMTGRHDVYVAIVRPRDVASDKALTTVSAAAAVRRAASYWRGQTGGKVRFRLVEVKAPYVSAHRCSDGVARLWAEAMERVDVPAGSGNHLVVFAPRGAARKGCYYGLGTIGATGGTGLTFVTETAQSLVAHELGHNLGLQHAGALHCKGAQDSRYRRGRWPSACRKEEYGDLLDVMGYSGRYFGEGSLNAANLDGLGMLPLAVRKIGSPGRYRVKIKPLSASPNSRRAIRIVERSGQTYYVEYRTNTGRDKAARHNRFRPALGVRVLRVNPQSGGALVLDPTPSRGNDYANSLARGRRFTSASGQLTIKVIRVSAKGATLEIRRK